MSTAVAVSHRRQRVVGALLGWIVGDALGAPFEFGPARQYSARFPDSVLTGAGEMTGGGIWAPGEWTDDTQMGLMVAQSLRDQGQLARGDVFDRFRVWADAGPKDIGTSTRGVLTSGLPWEQAAAARYRLTGHSAGNGSLMRAIPSAIWFSRSSLTDSMQAGRDLSALTHGDPAAGEGVAIYHGLIAAALTGDNPLDHLSGLLARIDPYTRGRWGQYLDPSWTPTPGSRNGDVWTTLGSAVWAVRRASDRPAGQAFPAAMRDIIDLGYDTDTLAAVTGGLLGATLGIQAIPSRWTNAVKGDLPGHHAPHGYTELQDLALHLDRQQPPPPTPALPVVPAEQVLPGLWLTNIEGVPTGPPEAHVISLCRPHGPIPQADRRLIYLLDDPTNLNLDTVIEDVLDTIDAHLASDEPVVVHCHAGQSRTGLILRAYLMRHQHLDPAAATRRARQLWPHTSDRETSFDAVLKRRYETAEA